ncbi:unnamed protein product [marine sediment metagenome]|uniref:Uncharacterized protein n=1 Tax=marine sediment metagenome TaxID=412755 RepID=X0XSL7_9ZZZZ
MLGVRLIDWMVIVVYLVGITVIGLWAVRKVRSAAGREAKRQRGYS